MERYEQLRRQAVGGDGSGWRLGLALLQHRGMAAWARASQPLPPVPLPRDGRDGSIGTVPAGVDAAGVVGVLAGMAAACVLGG